MWRHFQRFFFAGFYATLAANALALFVEYLAMRTPTFWVVAPDTAQRATFHEEGRPYARTIIDGISLDVEEDAQIRSI